MMMNVTNRGGLVMRFATALSVIVVLGIASSASAVFTEDFESFAAGDLIGNANGANGWQTVAGFSGHSYGSAGAIDSLQVTSNPALGGSQLAGPGRDSGGFGDAIARDVSGEIDGAGLLTVQGDFDLTTGSIDKFRMVIGTSASIIGGGHGELHWIEVSQNGGFGSRVHHDEDHTGAASEFIQTAGPALAWASATSGVDPTTEQFTVRLRHDTTTGTTIYDHRPIGGGSSDPWFDPQTITNALTPVGAADTFELSLQDGGLADNIIIGVVPEPASLTLLAFGGLLMLVRRRRRA